MHYDALVIGGGVVGASVAYHLVRGGARTLLIDRDDAGRATSAGAGILAPETSSRSSDAWFAFAVPAVDYYPTLINDLAADGAGDTGYAVCGQLEVAVSEDEVEPYAEARRIIFARQQQRGTPAPEDLHEVSSAEARQLFPPLADVRGALFYRHAARVDGRLLAAALRQAAVTRGLEVRAASVERLAVQNDTVTGAVVDGTTITADAVAIAGGAWSAAFGAQLGVHIPVEPQRGQIIHLDLPGIDTSTWPVITPYHGHYMVAWPDSRVVVGATRETGSGFAPFTSVAGIHEVLGEALRVAPGLRDARLREVRVGLRPATPDGLPVLGHVPGRRNIVLATGHGPTGLQLGPISGKIAADLMRGRAPEIDISAFDVTRFGTAS